MQLGDTVKTPTDLTGQIIKIIKSVEPDYPDTIKVQYSNGFTGYWPEEDVIVIQPYEQIGHMNQRELVGEGL